MVRERGENQRGVAGGLSEHFPQLGGRMQLIIHPGCQQQPPIALGTDFYVVTQRDHPVRVRLLGRQDGLVGTH